MFLNNNQSNTTIMKNTFIKYYLLSIVLLLSVGCFSDKGNYNYHDINDVTILNIEDDYDVIKGMDILHIEPIIEGTLTKGDSENYSYSWTIGDRTISTEKILNFDIDLEAGSYYLYFKVMDNSSGIEWKKYTYLNVSFPITRGFILASEDKEGYLQMDMIAMPSGKDTIILTDMLKDSELPKMKGARKIIHTGRSGEKFVRLWALGGDGAYFVDPTSFEGNISNSLMSMLYSSLPITEELYPIDIAGVARDGYGGMNRAIMCNNGWVVSTSLYSEEAYGNPKNFVKLETTEPFMPAPYLLYAAGNYNGAMVLYDKDGERFVKIGSYDDWATKLNDVGTDVFPWNNKELGRTLVYAENTKNTDGGAGNGNTFALMSNADKTQFWIYKLYAYNAKKIDGYDVIPAANAVANSSLYAFASNRTLMFYTLGNKLYAYDYNKGNEKFYDNLNVGNGSDEITMIKFDIQSGSTALNDLYIASYNATTGGTVRKVTLDISDMNTVTLVPDEKAVWTGLGKVKNMDWRNY